MVRRFFCLFLSIALLSACRKDIPPVAKEKPPEPSILRGELLVLNEGNFMHSNASLTKISLEPGTIEHDYYHTVNQQNMGDVGQSINFFGGKGYFVMNNSSKIIVTDSSTLLKQHEINGLNSPRYLCFVNSQKAYVSDLYANQIHIINPNQNLVTGHIALNGWTEEMILNNNKVFVGNWSGSATYIINTNNDQILDSVETGKHSAWLCADAKNNVWVLSSGDDHEQPRLSCINANGQIILRENLPFKKDICSKLVYDSFLNQLFFIAGDVYAYDIDGAAGARITKVINKGNGNFYGLNIDVSRRILMVSNARNYIQKGEVILHALVGEFPEINRYECGMIPGYMVVR